MIFLSSYLFFNKETSGNVLEAGIPRMQFLKIIKKYFKL